MRHMKCEASMDSDNWLNITVMPETPQEAGKLVQLAMAANKATRGVSKFEFTSEGLVQAHIALKPKRSNDGSWIVPHCIPTV